MKSSDWRNTAELIGIAAIVASLVFVGLQLRQDRQFALSENAADFNDTMIEYSSVIRENREIWLRGLEGAELTLEEQVVFESVAFAVWQKFSGIYRQSEALFQTSGEMAARQLAGELYIYPGLRNYVLSRCRHRESIGQQISFCDDVREQLKAFEDGTFAQPEGRLYVL
ncbi:MAG: hypothetical protein GWN81_06095 [Phycisphaerae bacterium]|nr:hypothetical protein [Phycisphaerae bacterium]NIU08425.1 hypothetical protein [Phycisphaerae bacterium]